MITYMNLWNSYNRTKQYRLAEEYMEKARPYIEAEKDSIYRFAFLVLECSLYWETGKKEQVYSHLDEMVEGAINDKNATDYVQDILDFCELLKSMKEYESWKKVIRSFEKYVREHENIYFKLLLTEMWMDYYKSTDDTNKYIQLCVEHAELSQKQKEISYKERATAIDIKIELREKEEKRKQAEKKSNTDPLTGLGNRFRLESDVPKLFAKAEEAHQLVGSGVLDIDCFKQKNDTYGHIEGDECISKVANIIQEAVEGQGHAYRYGGDEFVLLIQNASAERLQKIAEYIKGELHQLNMKNVNSYVCSELTISQGYACVHSGVDRKCTKLLEYADKALYKVKENGRNGYCIIDDEV